MRSWAGMLVAAAAAVVLQAGAARGAPLSPSRAVRVRGGDTLWAIGGRVCPAGADRRAVVEEIRRYNRLKPGEPLLAGTVLVLGREGAAVAQRP